MTTDDVLQPDILEQLRNVPVVSDDIREAHIATALAELRPAARRRRNVFLAAAAAVVLLATGFVVVQSQSSNSPAYAMHKVLTFATVPPKGSLTNVDPQFTSRCATAGEKVLGGYRLDNDSASLIATETGVRVALESKCEEFSYLPYVANRPSTQVSGDCDAPKVWELLEVAHFADANGYFYWIGINNQKIELWDCASQSIASEVSHPNTQ